MTVIRCAEKPDSRRKSKVADGDNYEYVLTLVTNSTRDNERTIENYYDVPRRGAAYRLGNMVDGNSVCDRTEIQRVGPKTWEVACYYVPASLLSLPTPKATQPVSDPLNAPVKVTWTSKEIEYYSPTARHTTGQQPRAFVNILGDRFANVPPLTKSHGILTITRNEASYSAVAAMQYAGKVNSTFWASCPPRTAKCFFPGAVRIWDDARHRYYWEIAYQFEVAPEGWDARIANTGKFHYIDQTVGGEGTRVKIPARDDFGNPTGEDVWLDEEGYKLSDERALAGDVVYLPPFRMYETIDFNRLGLI